MQRRQVFYSGSVQGVGFRYTTQTIAKSYDVTGYVRNLRDGRVELVVEGQGNVLQPFLENVRSTMGDHVANLEIIKQPATGEFTNFEIRF